MGVRVEVHNPSRGGKIQVTDGTTTVILAPGQRTSKTFGVGVIGGGTVTLTISEYAKPAANNYGPLDWPDT